MRHKVPRIKQTFTLQGMTPGELLLIVGLFFVGYRIGGALFTHPVAPFVSGFLFYFLIFPRIKTALVRYPPGYFGNYLRWLGTKDIYYPMPDDRVKPLVVAPKEEKGTETEKPGSLEPVSV